MKSGDKRRAQLIDAAIALGAARGVGALTVQRIASAAKVSKGLVLYHFHDRPGVVRAIADAVTARSAERLEAAVAAGVSNGDLLEEWRRLARDEVRRGEMALLAALHADAALVVDAATMASARETAAAQFAGALMESLGLKRRLPALLVGRLLLRQLDGLVIAYHDPGATTAPAESERGTVDRAADLEAELDAFALALLGLGE